MISVKSNQCIKGWGEMNNVFFFIWQLKPFTFELDVLTGITSHKWLLNVPVSVYF